MSDRSAIEWTNASWNPIRARNRATGKVGWFCEHASQGCRFCYAERQNVRAGASGGNGVEYRAQDRDQVEIFLDEKTLTQPLRWTRPRKIFPCSMTDLFGDWVTDAVLDRMFAVMAVTPQHTYQVVTKRAERANTYICTRAGDWELYLPEALVSVGLGEMRGLAARVCVKWPLPNLWLGVSCEDQATADERIPLLLQTPAAVRFVSAEPLLGPIDLIGTFARFQDKPRNGCAVPLGRQLVDWVIVGGESGAGARPMHPDWARSLRDQCAAAGVAFFFKQWGEWRPPLPTERYDTSKGRASAPPAFLVANDGTVHCFTETAGEKARGMLRVGKAKAGRLLDGRTHDEFPMTI